MANDRIDILFPEGRLIMGSLYVGSDKDSKGNLRVVKNGPNKGQPLTQFFMGVAIPKRGEQHWAQTEWGGKIYQAGAAAFPNIYQNPTFAWKIDDGDSQIPNKQGKKPCDIEGARGHWIVKLSSGFAPKVFAQPSPGVFQELTEQNAVKTGYWVQVSGSVAGNGSAESPGVYLNHGMVLFVRPDAEIRQGPDAATAFAGAAVSQGLPTGLPAVPFAGAPAMPAVPAMPVAVAMPPVAVAMPPVAVAVPPVAVAVPPVAVAVPPNPAFLAGPGAPALPAAIPPVPMAAAVPPAAPAVPAVPAEPQMTPAGVASGFTYQQYRQNGWSDAQMRERGLII